MSHPGTRAVVLLACLAVGCGGVSVRADGSSSQGGAGGGAAGPSAGAGGTSSSAAGSSAGAGGAAAGSAGASGAAGAPGDAQSGERIFDQGTGPGGQPIPRTDGVGMMNMNSCASCHGLDGHRQHMMMFSAPDITYANLTDPAGMIEPDGTRGETYTDALIRRAVVDGIGADGQPLDTSMPRWQLDEQEWTDLLAYLKTLQ